jgi:hypothetical protein
MCIVGWVGPDYSECIKLLKCGVNPPLRSGDLILLIHFLMLLFGILYLVQLSTRRTCKLSRWQSNVGLPFFDFGLAQPKHISHIIFLAGEKQGIQRSDALIYMSSRRVYVNLL